MNRAEIAGKIGGMVGGFKRRERQRFLVNFIKLVEMEEYPDLRLTSSLAKKLIAGFSGYKSISNDVLVKEFGRTNNKVKQQNLDDIVTLIVARHKDTYKDLWNDAKRKIEYDADAYKKRVIQRSKPLETSSRKIKRQTKKWRLSATSRHYHHRQSFIYS